MLDETLAFFTQLSFYKHGLKMVIGSYILQRSGSGISRGYLVKNNVKFPGVIRKKSCRISKTRFWFFLGLKIKFQRGVCVAAS